jgi:hypothetical protein
MTADRPHLLARGLLAGEALSSADAGYRLRLMPPKRLARMETLAAFAREHGTTTPAVPYAHSSPVAVLQPGAGEAVEWFAFAVRAQRGGLDDAWRRLAEDPGPARIGTRIPLDNLRRGLSAPQSGNDNPHYFDDLPMVRAVAAAAIADDESGAREAARRDAAYTAALDGLWCAEATAVLVARLLAGSPVDEAVEAARVVLPEGTWSRRLAEEALATAAQASGALDRAQRLSAGVGDWIYSYATVAPETLAMLLAHVRFAASAEELLLGVFAQPRNAATLPALAGAVAAVVFGEGWMPRGLDLDSRLAGVGIPDLAGVTISDALAPDAEEPAA